MNYKNNIIIYNNYYLFYRYILKVYKYYVKSIAYWNYYCRISTKPNNKKNYKKYLIVFKRKYII